MRVHAQQGDTVDALCWRHLGRTASLVERTLEMNPGVCEHGPILPHGTAVDLPTITAIATAAERPLVQLWD